MQKKTNQTAEIDTRLVEVAVNKLLEAMISLRLKPLEAIVVLNETKKFIEQKTGVEVHTTVLVPHDPPPDSTVN